MKKKNALVPPPFIRTRRVLTWLMCHTKLRQVPRYKPLYLYRECSSQDVIKQMVNDISKPVNKVLQEVTKKKGKLVVCSLLPGLRNEISTSIFKQMLEEVYEKANLDLKRINLMLSKHHYWIDQLHDRKSKQIIKGYFASTKIHFTDEGQEKICAHIKPIGNNICHKNRKRGHL